MKTDMASPMSNLYNAAYAKAINGVADNDGDKKVRDEAKKTSKKNVEGKIMGK